MNHQNAFRFSFKVVFVILLLSSLLFLPAIGSAETDSKGIPDDAIEINGHYYKAYENRLTWNNAKAYCKSLGGHLMTITSAEEQALLRRLSLNPRTNYWIGAISEKQGNWKWITGEKWSFSALGIIQSDPGLDKEYLQVCADDGYLWKNSADNPDITTNIGFICEWENRVVVLAPTQVYATQLSAKKIELTWSGASGAKTYEIYCSNGINGTFRKLGKTKKTKFTDSSFKNGKVYQYMIRAVNGDSGAYSYRVTAYPTKKRVKITKIEYDEETDRINICWDQVPNANSYEVYEKKPLQDNFVKLGNIVSTSTWYIPRSGDGKYQYYIVPKIDSFRFTQSKTKSFELDKIIHRAVIIGQKSADKACETDAKATKSMLNNLDYTKYKGNITKITDATVEEMKSTIREVFRQADDDDVTLLFYSGHGHYNPGSPSNGALVGSDHNYYFISELRATLDHYKGKKVIILNSCHSGSAIGRENGNSDSQNGFSKAFNASVIQAFSAKADNNLVENDYFVLTSCNSEQTSAAMHTGTHYWSPFVRAFLYGVGWDEYRNKRLSSLNADTDGKPGVSLYEAFNYTKKAMKELETEYNENWDMDVQYCVTTTGNRYESLFCRN